MTQIDKGHEMLSFVWGLPRPTYIVGSGTGLHLYFVFERPIPLFRSTCKGIRAFKKKNYMAGMGHRELQVCMIMFNMRVFFKDLGWLEVLQRTESVQERSK